MAALVAAYVLVWLAVQVCVVWLGVRQRQLEARLDALAAQIEQREPSSNSVAHAA